MEKICHICLEEKTQLLQEDIKRCCNAFICNSCWIELVTTTEIPQCPICKRSIVRINRIESENNVIERSFWDNYEKCIFRMLKYLSWILIGYLIVVFILLVSHYNNIDLFWRDLKFVSSGLHYWIAMTCVGYIVFYCIRCSSEYAL